jgi:hypothetical protein
MGRGKRRQRHGEIRAVAAPSRPRLTPTRLLEAAHELTHELNSALRGQAITKTSITEIERRFHDHLERRFQPDRGSSARGTDLPRLGYDIKVTSTRKPQSSAPYNDPSEKIFGLQYGILVFPYSEPDGHLVFERPVLIRREETGDRRLTTQLLALKRRRATRRELAAFLSGAEPSLSEAEIVALTERVHREEFQLGRLTLSDARQWRVRFREAIRDATASQSQPAAA